MGKLLNKFFGKDKKTPVKPTNKPTAKVVKQKPQQPKKAPEVAGKDKEILAEYKKHWPNIDETSIRKDTHRIKERYGVKTDGKLDEAKTLTKIKDSISKNAVSNSNLNKILATIKEALPGKTFKVRLMDIQLETIKANDLPKVLAVIKIS